MLFWNNCTLVHLNKQMILLLSRYLFGRDWKSMLESLDAWTCTNIVYKKNRKSLLKIYLYRVSTLSNVKFLILVSFFLRFFFFFLFGITRLFNTKIHMWNFWTWLKKSHKPKIERQFFTVEIIPFDFHFRSHISSTNITNKFNQTLSYLPACVILIFLTFVHRLICHDIYKRQYLRHKSPV